MKKINMIILAVFVFLSQNILASGSNTCGTTSSNSGSSYIPTSGNIKVLVIFAQFKDDPQIDNNGWAKDTYPSWANNFINPSAGGSYPWHNLSHYYNEMSNGSFQVIGDVYNSLVITNHNESYYSSVGQVNHEVLLAVDPYVDFSEYDNLNGNSFGSDGKVDFIYIIYRNATASYWWYTAIAHLELSSTIYADGVQIVSNSYIGSGVQQRAGYNGKDFTMYTAAHEMGHYLFGGGHIDFTTNLCLMSGLPVWNGSRGMHSWEREYLGWISYTNKSTNGTVTLSDYMTTDKVYRVPVNGNSDYFLIENRKHYSPHDKAKDTGIYIYHITSGSSYPPNIDVECADGDWDFSFNNSTKKITRENPNPNNGKDEMNYVKWDNGDKYACFTPHYFENSAWGDDEDAFDTNFNNVFSPASNPRNKSSNNFSIEVTGTNTIKFYFTSPYAGVPSKPQNIKVTSNGTHPVVSWDANTEPDLNGYRIYRSVDGGSFQTLANVNKYATSYVDVDAKFSKPIWQVKMVYKIKAKDTQGKYSVYSNSDYIYAEENNSWKKAIRNAEEKSITTYSVSQNFPNPFNPTTTISYQIPKAGNVQIKVYDLLGKEVALLVNEQKEPGRYNVQFDATNLPSGLYFYRMQAGKFTDVRKMLLMK